MRFKVGDLVRHNGSAGKWFVASVLGADVLIMGRAFGMWVKPDTLSYH